MFPAQRIVAACDLDQLRSPVAGAKWRVDPFHQETARPMLDLDRSFADRFDASRQARHDFLGTPGHTARFANAADVVADIRETGRLEAHDLGRTGQSLGQPRHRSVAYGADVAKLLGKDYVRPQIAQERLVDGVDGALLAQGPPHPLVHFFARQANAVNRAMRNAGTGVGVAREIALVGDADHVVHQAERGRDLSRRGQERNDSSGLAVLHEGRGQSEISGRDVKGITDGPGRHRTVSAGARVACNNASRTFEEATARFPPKRAHDASSGIDANWPVR